MLCAASIAVLVLARHAVRAQLFRAEVGDATRAAIMRRSLIGPPAFAATAATAFLWPAASIAGMFCIMAYYGVPARIERVAERTAAKRTEADAATEDAAQAMHGDA